MGGGGDAVNEDNLVVCCSLCCANIALYPTCDCAGCSGKIGLCCLNCEVCCKMGADCLPCCCCGPAIECDGCSVCNAQLHCCCAAVSAALPCNDEVPCVLNVAGWTMYPRCKCFAPMREIMGR